jgi:hypothetical protein
MKNKGDFKKYVINNVEYPRVSDIISVIERKEIREWKERVGKEEAEKIAKETSEYGTMVHDVTMWNDMNKMKKVEKMIKEKEWLIPHWIAWFDWVNEYVEKIHHVELVVWSEKLKCAGRIDRVMTIKGDKKPSIVDIKTGNLYDDIGIQLAGYKELYNEKYNPKVNRIIAVSLPRKNPGHLQVKDYTKPEYKKSFINAVKLYHQINQ